MAGYKWKRTAAMLLTGAMLMSPGQYVFAAEGQPEEIAADASAESLDALDGNGSVVSVSDVVLGEHDSSGEHEQFEEEAGDCHIRDRKLAKTDGFNGDGDSEVQFCAWD